MTLKPLKHPFFVIIGPSGAGKTKVAEAVFPPAYKVISHTTRPIRKDEQEGKDYYFETKQLFGQLITSHSLAEYDLYHGHYYGVGISELYQKTMDHYAYDVLTFKGFQAIEQLFGHLVIPIFLEVNKENVLSRLKTREDEPETIKERLALYEQEARNLEKMKKYQCYFTIDANQAFELVVKEVEQVVAKVAKKE
ncbi:guanylate kinase [Candidatus Enterococcus mansonii]|uniref:Guanylate kinase-like domain-containing protein n=1 Tax=Candidatus Enterococcus mansonii TaxID=1834181 RepID=A0A242CJS1_9ENTE|nr:guanylate kinase [Enterococcus sp. 4G2_DIV0659]OTO10032.1 hypothetical protein A5880_000715 [Enterococcus sp. 4G2_DIV0659]